MNGGGTAQPLGARASVPTIVFHGDADRTVNAANGDRIIAQSKPEGGMTRSMQNPLLQHLSARRIGLNAAGVGHAT
jgi:hypothetical protein